MNEDIKEKIKLILDPPRPQPIFREDDVITLDLVDYIRGLPSHVNMSKLFVKPNHLGARRPNYDFHGYELQNIAKLKCLCKDCHEKFHKE